MKIFVDNPSTIPGMSEVLRNGLKRVTLKGHQDYLPILFGLDYFREAQTLPPPPAPCPVSSFFLMCRNTFLLLQDLPIPHPSESITQIHKERSSFLSASPQQPSAAFLSQAKPILFISLSPAPPFLMGSNLQTLSSFRCSS